MKEGKIKITGDKILDDIPAGNTLDVATVSALAAVVERHGLSELKLSLAGGTLVIRRGPPAAPPPAAHAAPPAPSAAAVLSVPQPVPVAAALGASTPPVTPAPVASVAHETNGQYVYVSSPFVGTFYCSPSPGSPPFVEIGQRVKKGDVLCIVEAMKLMNEIESDVDGVVAAVMVDNAQPVEYGQALYKLTPA